MSVRHRRRMALGVPLIATVGLIVLASVAGWVHAGPAGAAAQPAAVQPAKGHFGTQTPYAPAQALASYQAAPQGFTPVFTELVARHGSRAPSDAEAIMFLEQVIAYAMSAGQIQPPGAQLLAELKDLEATSRKVGFGNLSGLGRSEQAGIATRLVQRLPQLFNGAAAGGRHVTVVNGGEQRDVDSGTVFAGTLKGAVPSLTLVVNPAVTDPDLLLFHESEANADARTFARTDPTLLAKLTEITSSDESKEVAAGTLEKLFGKDFVADLNGGLYAFPDPDTGTFTVKRAVDVVESLYEVYAIEPDLSAEGTFHFERFLSDAAAAHFEYVDDADSFYRKGPSFAESTITFTMAKVLEDDFFNAVTAFANGSNTDVARLRFTHAEEIIPLAALMRLPGSDQQLPANETYTREDSNFRGAEVAPMSANIQWDIFRDASGTLLVRMLYNEKEAAFKADCQPFAAGSHFYAFTELQRCYGYLPAGG